MRPRSLLSGDECAALRPPQSMCALFNTQGNDTETADLFRPNPLSEEERAKVMAAAAEAAPARAREFKRRMEARESARHKQQ